MPWMRKNKMIFNKLFDYEIQKYWRDFFSFVVYDLKKVSSLIQLNFSNIIRSNYVEKALLCVFSSAQRPSKCMNTRAKNTQLEQEVKRCVRETESGKA